MWTWIRIPKAVALIAFFLPWMTVSCSGQKLVSATGTGIAIGRYTSEIAAGRAARNTDQQADLWIIAALLLVVAALAITLASPTRRNAAISATLSLLSAVCVWAGTLRFSERHLMEAIARDHPGQRLDLAEATSVIRIEWHLGYWLTLAALLVAAAMAALAASGRALTVTPPDR